MRTRQERLTAFAPASRLDDAKGFFLVGIGGAGMSPLAVMLRGRGLAVRGTDIAPSPVIDHLRELGCEVTIGHDGSKLQAGDAVVLSDAIPLDFPEPIAAIQMGLSLFRRSQLLGWLLKEKRVLAITGTHGKTTTTGMVGAALQAAGLQPTIVVGAEVPEFGGSVIEGHGPFAVVEACEAYDSFHDLDPAWAVITNLEPDHLDYHGTWANLKASVRDFVNKLPADGGVVVPAAQEWATDVLAASQGTVVAVDLGRGPDEAMALPGTHNRANAALALALCEAIGVPRLHASPAVAAFRGAERRLQVLRDVGPVVVDDYAHHPTEIVASIGALRERYPNRRLIVVFQPHLYSRTRDLLPDFARALSLADRVVLTDIYPAREEPIPGISSARIGEHVTCPVDYVPSRHLLPRFVAQLAQIEDVVAGMGAGNIGAFAPEFIRELARSGPARVLVVSGGDSAEREVSLHSGAQATAALRRKGYTVEHIDLSDRLLGGASLPRLAGIDRPDVVFLAVHGTHAEDGAIQGFCELLHLPYTGSGIQASALAMDKQRTKQLLAAAGLPVPHGFLFESVPDEWPLPPPVVMKPNAQGSTVGLSFVETEEEWCSAFHRALAFGPVLVEEWIRGTEISVPVLGDRPLPPVEIVPASGRYDFASKYEIGATEEICPARLTGPLEESVQELALAAHRALGCEGATRTDMIIRDGQPVILEVNTLPGLTATSLLPKSAATAGIPYDELCAWLVEDAIRRHARRQT